MAADGTSIKTDIDNELSGKGYRGVRVFNVVLALKKVVDWVTSVVNGNLSAWLRGADNQPGGSSSDSIYRTGETEFRGATYFKTRTPTNAGLASIPSTTYTALQIAGTNGGPAWLEFHLPGFLIHQLGADSDGVLKLRPWGENKAYPLIFDAYNPRITTNNVLNNKKLALFDAAGNEHQFIGFGVNSNVLRYQVDNQSTDHIFYSGLTPATSTELMRIRGNGTVGIGITPNSRNGLEVGKGWFSVVTNVGGYIPGSGQGAMLGWNYSSGGGETNFVWGTQTVGTAWLAFQTWNGSAVAEMMRLTPTGNLLIGQVGTGTARLHVNGPSGHQQFRLEQSYTPTGTADANGTTGHIAWDANYIYVKTPAGWKRSALTTF